MKYNTGREHLIIPEYGRHVQKMVKHATGIKDKKERKECVEAIITFMGHRNHTCETLKILHTNFGTIYLLCPILR